MPYFFAILRAITFICQKKGNHYQKGKKAVINFDRFIALFVSDFYYSS
jgi:hypothetical protein